MAKKGSKFNKYKDDFKLMVVEEYLSGKIGYDRLAKKCQIPSKWPIMQWVKKYNSSNGDVVSAFEDHRKYLSGRPRQNDISIEDKIKRLEAENAF
jgi:hypothetical protein